MCLDPHFQNISHSGGTLTIDWFAGGSGWQGGSDESWAIDNVEVILDGVCGDLPVDVGGRMTGSGSVIDPVVGRVTHGFQLHCEKSKLPNNLEVNWGKGNNFHLDALTAATCSDDPLIIPNPPPAGFNTYKGAGSGTCNGAPATPKWTFTDAGEPGKNDKAKIEIAGGCTLNVGPSNLNNGNHQAHKK